MDKKMAMRRISRLDEVLELLKNLAGISKYEDIAKILGYKRSGTLSDYKNIDKYEEAKFTNFVNHLALVFQFDPEYILSDDYKGGFSATSPNWIDKSNKKEVIALGKKVPMRLKEEDFADAFPDWKGLPMYNTPVTASFIETYRDEATYTPQYYMRDPRFKDCDFGAIITGDSMHSEIRHGDFIACKEVVDTRFIVFGDIYYVVATNGLETCKYVNYDPMAPDTLILVAKNDKIPPSPLPKDMLYKLYKVRGIVRGY